MSWIYSVIYNERYRNVFFKMGELLLGAILGLLIGLPLDNDKKIFICLAIVMLIFLVCFLMFLMEKKDPKKFDIIRFIKSADYEVAISWAYTMRNLLSHAGYLKLKVEIATIVYTFFDKYHIDDSQVIYDTGTTAGIIKATFLIDDFGWYNFELSFDNAEISICKIKDGIALAKACCNYLLVIRGYRHLSNIYINQAIIMPKTNRRGIVAELETIKAELENIKRIDSNLQIDSLVTYIDVYINVFSEIYECALDLAERGLHTADSEASAKLNESIGIIHYYQKDYGKAISDFQKAANAAKKLRPGRYVSIVIRYFIVLKDSIEENYTNQKQRLTSAGKRERLQESKELFDTARKIAISRDSTKLHSLIQSYKELRKVIKK